MFTEKLTDGRRDRRHPFHWPVAIVFDSTEDRDTFHGISHDISLSGCSILTEHNVFSEHPISVLIAIPAENPSGRRKVVEATARMVYTVLSHGHQQFRSGMEFIKFKGKGRSVLRKAIETRSIFGSEV